MITLYHFLVLSVVLFCIGGAGVLLRRDAVTLFMGIELMLNSVNLAFLAFSRLHGNAVGQIFVLMVIAVAAAEAAVGLALIILLKRKAGTVDVSGIRLLRG